MKRIALINDLSGFGKCSLTAAIPVISVMGIQACPLPTAILSGQTGFSDYYYDDYTDKMNNITNQWSQMSVSFDGIYSGYLGNPQQIENVLYFLERFKTDKNIFLVDPVMGDNGNRIKIFTDDLLNTMKSLTQKADIITPNLTEACLLADVDYSKLISCKNEKYFKQEVLDIAEKLYSQADNHQTVIITGIVRETNNKKLVSNLAYSSKEHFFLESEYTGKSFSGTGDLFASVLIGSLVKGLSIYEAINKAMKFLIPAIEDASSRKIDHNHGIEFETYLSRLLD